MTTIKILGICGSLRYNSLNRKALEIAARYIASEPDVEYTEANLKILNLPIYDGDIEDAGMPDSVLSIKSMVEASDIILIASPEYNHSISPALKNVIDWGSRGNNSWDGKWAIIIGVSTGNYGTIRMQIHLRQVLAALNVSILHHPQILIPKGDGVFKSDDTFSDEVINRMLQKLIKATIEKVRNKVVS